VPGAAAPAAASKKDGAARLGAGEIVGIALATVAAAAAVAAAVILFWLRGDRGAVDTKSPTVDLHEIKWATPRDGKGGAPAHHDVL